MKRARPYLSLLVGLLLFAGPWLQSAEFTAVSDVQTCNSSQNLCQGCCCTVVTPENENSNRSADGCRCDISQSPAVPESPIEIHEYRTDNHLLKTRLIASAVASTPADAGSRLAANNNPPRSTSSPPAYLVHGALLI